MILSGEELNNYWQHHNDLDQTLDSLEANGYTFESWLQLGTKQDLEAFITTLIDHNKFELIATVQAVIAAL